MQRAMDRDAARPRPPLGALRNRWRNSRKAFCVNFFLPYIALFLLPVLAMSVFLFTYVRDMVEEQVITGDMRILSNVRSSVDQMIVDMSAIHSGIVDFNYLEYTGADGQFAYYTAAQKLRMFLESNGKINGLYYYLVDDGTIVTTNGVYDLHYDHWVLPLNRMPVAKFRELAFESYNRPVVPYGDALYFFYPSGEYIHYPEHVVAFEVQAAKLLGMIEGYTGASTYVFSAAGEPLVTPRDGAPIDILSLTAGAAGEGFVTDSAHDMLITYAVSSLNGWIFANAHSRNGLLARLVMMETAGIFILLAVTLAGFLVIAGVTRRTFRPMRSLFNHVESDCAAGAPIASMGKLADRVSDVYVSNRELRAVSEQYVRMLQNEIFKSIVRGQLLDLPEFRGIISAFHSGACHCFRLLLLSEEDEAEEWAEPLLAAIDSRRILEARDSGADKARRLFLLEDGPELSSPQALAALLPGCGGARPAIALSCELYSLEEVRRCYYNGLHAFERHPEPGAALSIKPDIANPGPFFRRGTLLANRFQSELDAGDYPASMKTCREFFASTREALSPVFLRCLCYDFAVTVMRRAEDALPQDNGQLGAMMQCCEICDTARLEDMILSLLRTVGSASTAVPAGHCAVQAATEYVEAHYGDVNLSMQGIAAELGYSYKYLSRVFKEETGERLSEYINRTRVRHFKEQLAVRTDPLISIIHDVGFESAATFNRVFKSLEGIPPGQYRELASRGGPGSAGTTPRP